MTLLSDRWDPQWDERFTQEGFFYGKEPNDFLRENFTVFSPKGKILCLAEGEGRNAVFLAGKGFEVTAMDGSGEGLKKTHHLAQEKNVTVTTEAGDLVDYQMGEEKWDGIVSIWCHLPKTIWKAMLLRVTQALKPGGIFLLESYTPQQIGLGTGGPSNEDWMATIEELKAVFTSFTLLHAKELKREIHEGKAHNGLSAVVQFIARR